MANWFSNHTTSGVDQNSLPTSPQFVPSGIGHSRARLKIATIDTSGSNPASGDVYRMMSFKSSDRLFELRVSNDGGHDVVTSADVGLYTYNADHDGAVLDVDLFDAALDLTAAGDWDEILTDGALSGVDRGKQLWEQYAVGAGSDTSDPQVTYEIGIALTAEPTVGGVIVMSALYTSGD